MILTLRSAPTAVLSPSFSFRYKPCPSGALQPAGLSDTRLAAGDQEVALPDVAFVLLFSFNRIKTSIAGTLLHSRTAPHGFVSNSPNKVFLVVIVPCYLDLNFFFFFFDPKEKKKKEMSEDLPWE